MRNLTKETDLKITDFHENEGGTDGVLITLHKKYDSKTMSCSLAEKSYINMSTTHNITFYRGLIIEKSFVRIPLKKEIKPNNEESEEIKVSTSIDNNDE